MRAPALVRPTVLMYHGFSLEPRTDDPSNHFVTVSSLRSQLAFLDGRGWKALDLDGYLACLGRGQGARRALVTIDDGFSSVLELAAPVFAAAGVPTVFFVPAERIGATVDWVPELAGERLLDADALRALRRDHGVEIGVHGLDHVALDGLDDAALLRQTVDAREIVADAVGAWPRSFSYPFGAFDERARRAVERAGYDVGFSVHRDAGRFAVSRVDVNGTDTSSTFRVKLLPGYRRWWRALERAGGVRRVARAALGGTAPLAAADRP